MNNQLIMEMTRYYSGDPKHIQHFMKVYAYARTVSYTHLTLPTIA